MLDGVALAVDVVNHHRYYRVQVNFLLVIGNLRLLGAIELQSFALRAFAQLGDVIQAKYHVLRRHRDGRTVGRVKNVVRAKHQHLRLHDGLVAKRQVHGHLVAVEVGVECRTSQRVQLYGLAFNHSRLECLDTKAVKCRGTVKQHRVTLHHIFKDVPYHGFAAVNNLLGTFNGLHNAALYKLAYNKRLVKLGSHILGQAALVHLQLGTNDDYRTSRIIDTLTKQVLAETTRLAFKAVGKRLQRTVGIGLHRTRLARVVEERVNGLLQHTLFVAQDYLRSLYFDKAFQAVVADNHAAVQVVKVAGGETSTIERHKRAQLGRNNGNHLQYHPFGAVAVLRRAERLNHLQAFQRLGLALLRLFLIGPVAQLV